MENGELIILRLRTEPKTYLESSSEHWGQVPKKHLLLILEKEMKRRTIDDFDPPEATSGCRVVISTSARPAR